MSRRAILVLVLVLAACTPKEEELAGGPKADDSELAGGAPATGIVLPGVLNLATPAGMKVLKDCEKIVAPDYDHPPSMTCLYAEGDGPAPKPHDEETDPVIRAAMEAAGWKLIRPTGAERYFEREKPGTDCADLAVMIVLEPEETDGLAAAAKAGDLPAGKAWRGYAFPSSVREACGADRMTP